MQIFVNRLFHVQPGEWVKLLQFGMLALLLNAGIGIGFSASDAAFISNVGPDKLPLIFMLTPAVMLVYTALFSYLMVRFSIDHVVDITLAMLFAGGVILWALFEAGLPPEWQTVLYYVLKLYVVAWYIAIYSLFWNFTDTYFDIQDAKRLFPLFSACCALGMAIGASIVGLFAASLPMHYFMLIWSGIVLLTVPVAQLLRRRWQRIADSDIDIEGEEIDVRRQIALVISSFGRSPYVLMLTLTLFVTLLLTNLIEFQYSTVFEVGRSEAQLAALFGQLYAAANIFNLLICLFLFNRLVGRMGVRNVALILPVTYFAAFGFFFLVGGPMAALAAFFAYHGVLTSIEYNNQNLLFNAVPMTVKRPLRTVIEGLAEPLASFLSGGFLLLAAFSSDMRQLSGIGVITSGLLIFIVMALRHYYPAAMTINMRRGWMSFAANVGPGKTSADIRANPAVIDHDRTRELETLLERLETAPPKAVGEIIAAMQNLVLPGDIGIVRGLTRILPKLERAHRLSVIDMLGTIDDAQSIPNMVESAAQLSPFETRKFEGILRNFGDIAIPSLTDCMSNADMSYRARSLSARALAMLSPAQFNSQLDQIVESEVALAHESIESVRNIAQEADQTVALRLLAQAIEERIGASVDFVLELLALGGRLPNFDLLIVSLHSANQKVRGNAIETIESGLNHSTFKMLKPLIEREDKESQSSPTSSQTGICELLSDILQTPRPFEVAAAAHALSQYYDVTDLAPILRNALKSRPTQMVRSTIAILLNLDAEPEPTIIDQISAIQKRPELAKAPIMSLLALAEQLTSVQESLDDRAIDLNGQRMWLRRRHIEDVACRFPALALIMLRMQDGRAYAA
ncbi:MFS transporter [Parasphingorhabdus sp.]|uniref:MFS transporter n=1 Tax=Parasphingorhabdus sp. TaxID=2709688 RepID=UPI002F92B26C